MSAEYRIWLGIKRRCQSPKSKDFRTYGARGITVCRRWDHSFEAFLRDVGPRPSARHMLGRQNVERGYEPRNCKWVEPEQRNSENRRNIYPVKVGRVRYASMAAAARAHGVPVTTASERIKRGISVVSAVTTPLRRLPNKRPRESYLPRANRA